MFDTFDDIRKLDKILPSKKCKFVFGLKSINLFASKAALSIIFGKAFPKSIPYTWNLSIQDDMNDLYNQFDKFGKPMIPMILKKDVQRQTGLKFVNTISDLKDNYVVCQKVLTNPFLVNNRKINLRIYLLVVCTENVNMYMYNDGFVYYTQKEYSATISFETHITTGYVDRKLYETNPLTLQDLYVHLGKDKEVILKRNIFILMNNVHTAYKKPVHANDTNTEGVCNFAILGIDLAPDQNLEVTLMEMNKGPDLNEKDERDGILKRCVVKDAFRICKLLPKSYPKVIENKFIKLI